MSLQDKRVVVTRAPHQAGELADLLTARGAIPVLYPCIAILPTRNDDLPDVSAFDWLILTSTNTVEALRGRLTLTHTSRPKIATVGASTTAALRDAFGVSADFIPDVQTAEHLAAHVPVMPGERVLLPGSAIAKPDLAQILTERGADVTAVHTYQTVIGTGGEDVPHMLQAGQIDAVAFTSSSTVIGFIERVGAVPDVPAACIGSVTAQTAQTAGFRRILTPQDDYSLDGLIAVMESEL